LSAAGCGIGDSAQEVLARPAFVLSAHKANVSCLPCRQPNSVF
jgi:hypothetical protein